MKLIRKTLFTILCFLLLTVSAFGATYYVDFTAGADSNNGTGEGTAFKYAPGMAKATGNAASTTLSGDDIVYFKMGEVWRDTITVGQSGTSGHPITYARKTDWGSGDNPKILTTDIVTGWSVYSEEYDIYRASIPEGTTVAYGILNEAQTSRSEIYYSKPSSSSWIDKYMWGGYYNNDGYVYIRDTGKDPDDWTLPPEVGVREFGIYGYWPVNYITIDGIDFQGPEGDPDEPDSDQAKRMGGIYSVGCQNWVIKNCSFEHFKGCGVYVKYSDNTMNHTIQDSYFNNNWGGIWSSHGWSNPVCSVGTGITIQRVYIEDTGNMETDTGDRDAIGVFCAKDILIEDSYIVNTCNMHIDLAKVDGYIIRRNYLKDSEYRAIGNNGYDNSGTYGNHIYNNIIDGWAQRDSCNDCAWDNVGYCCNAINIGFGSADHIKNLMIANNLITNGGPYAGTAMKVGSSSGTWEGYAKIINNIFTNNNCNNSSNPFSQLIRLDLGNVTRQFYNNYLDTNPANGDDIVRIYSDYYDYDELATMQSDYDAWMSDNYNQDDGTLTDAAGDDPQLNQDFTHSEGTPAVIKSGGLDLEDAEFDKGLSIDRIWTPYDDMLLSIFTRDTEYPIGPYDSGFLIHTPTPTSPQSCGYVSGIGVTSSDDADCKWSLKDTDTCSTAYGDLDNAFDDNGGGETDHDTTTDIDTDCDETNIYIVKCEQDVTDAISNCLEITVDISKGGGEPPQPAPGTIIGGGNVTIVGGGNVTIH